MVKKRMKPEQVVTVLRQIEVAVFIDSDGWRHDALAPIPDGLA